MTGGRCSSLMLLSTSNHDGCVKFRASPRVRYLVDAVVHQQTCERLLSARRSRRGRSPQVAVWPLVLRRLFHSARHPCYQQKVKGES